jgi:hypothetical protein
VKEYDLFVPLYYNDGSVIEPRKLQEIQRQLLEAFDGLTFFPQSNEGFWKMGAITYRDDCHLPRTFNSTAFSQTVLVGIQGPFEKRVASGRNPDCRA